MTLTELNQRSSTVRVDEICTEQRVVSLFNLLGDLDSAADWQSWRERLAAASASFWEEDHGGQRSLYVVDPSSNVIEITTPKTPPFADRSDQPDATPDGIVDRLIGRVTSGR